MKKVGIYKITSPSGKVYIGQSWFLQRRFKYYKNLKCECQTLLYHSILKHGWNAHKAQIIHELPSDVTQEILDRYEQFYMDTYRNAGFTLLNLREAGSNGKLHPLTLEKMRAANIGKKRSEQMKEKTRLRMMGKKIGLGNKHTEEWKLQNSLRHLGKPKPKGAKHTPEMNAKKSSLKQGTTMSIQAIWKSVFNRKINRLKKIGNG